MTADRWFEISNEGWRRLNAGRPLADLVREAIQNAFDEDVSSVEVSVDASTIVIEDDGERGFSDERLVYTVFMTGKSDSPTKRGRKGRGLKELISACDGAVVETVGTSIRFDRDGRHQEANQRRRGTCLTLHRRNSAREVEQALEVLRTIIVPEGTTLHINRRDVTAPEHFVTIPDCHLPTVVTRQGIERSIERACDIELYEPRRTEAAHLFEMGIPVQRITLPWHVDIAQRVPLADGRDRVDELYRLIIYATVFETLVEEHLPARTLREDWITEVLTRCDVADDALAAYATRVYPAGAVLSSTRNADDRARQVGTKIIDTRSMSRGVVASLSRVIETSEDMVERELMSREEAILEPQLFQQRALELYAHIGRQILGRSITVSLMRKPRSLRGSIDDAVFDSERMELRLNVEGSVDLHDPLAPTSLSILFHELAHVATPTHDARFIRELEKVAGKGARLLADEAAQLRARFLQDD